MNQVSNEKKAKVIAARSVQEKKDKLLAWVMHRGWAIQGYQETFLRFYGFLTAWEDKGFVADRLGWLNWKLKDPLPEDTVLKIAAECVENLYSPKAADIASSLKMDRYEAAEFGVLLGDDMQYKELNSSNKVGDARREVKRRDIMEKLKACKEKGMNKSQTAIEIDRSRPWVHAHWNMV